MKNNIKLLIAIACLICYRTDQITAADVVGYTDSFDTDPLTTVDTDPLTTVDTDLWGTGDQDDTQGSWVNGEWVEYGSDDYIQNGINDLKADSTDLSKSSTAQTAVVTKSNNGAITVDITDTDSTSAASDEEPANNERVAEILAGFGEGVTEANATIEQKTAAITQLLSETVKANTTSSTPFLDSIVKIFNAIKTFFTKLGTGLTEIFAPQNITNSPILTTFKAGLQQDLVNVPDLSNERMADVQTAVIDPDFLPNDPANIANNVANARTVLGIKSTEFTETDIDNAMADKSLQKASLNQVIDAENTGINIANNIQTAKDVLINYLETKPASQTSTNSRGGFNIPLS